LILFKEENSYNTIYIQIVISDSSKCVEFMFIDAGKKGVMCRTKWRGNNHISVTIISTIHYNIIFVVTL